MTFKTHCQMSKGLVDPTPLVNIVFLLLLFFLLSSPFVMQSGFGVIMPSTSTPTRMSFQSLVVTVARDNLLFFDNSLIASAVATFVFAAAYVCARIDVRNLFSSSPGRTDGATETIRHPWSKSISTKRAT